MWPKVNEHLDGNNDLKIQLTTLQGNHKELLDQLSDKSKQLVTFKSDVDRINQQNHSLADELALYEDRAHKLKQELKHLQEQKEQSEEQFHHLCVLVLAASQFVTRCAVTSACISFPFSVEVVMESHLSICSAASTAHIGFKECTAASSNS